MSLIIDAYNVLPHAHLLPGKLADVGAAGLCKLIQRVGVAHGRAYVVCDGLPRRHSNVLKNVGTSRKEGDELWETFGRVELIYAGGGKDADTLIEKLIAADSAPRKLFVVSDDHRIQRAASKRGATVVPSPDFVRRLATALKLAAGRGSHPVPSGPAETEDWLQKFQVGPEPFKPDEIASETDRWLKEFGLDEGDA